MTNPLHFDLQSLRVFLLAAELGSLTRAAERAHLTLSAVSKRICDLEKTIDCPLFVRQPRGLELTPAGQELLEHTRTILDNVNRMAADIGEFATGVRGHLRLWANTSAVLQFLPDDLAAFLGERPQVRISLEERLTEEIIAALDSERIDLGVFADNLPAPTLQLRPYRQSRLVLLVPVGHPLAKFGRIAFVDTLAYDHIGLAHGTSLLRLLIDSAVTAQRILRLRMQVGSFDAIGRMVEAGLGIGVVPDGAVHGERLKAGLRAIPLTDDWASRTLWVGVKSEETLLPEARELWQFLLRAGEGGLAR
ncbi:LysR family transcriptional regulator [Azorhizophilus paspali]|uniref:LysR family transcriptional regulator n=1 Tax=Azorhizophilus paspali TaxID=69963 RepID=A0ABV6SIP2_AZOPA